jgi:hypothetical protein
MRHLLALIFLFKNIISYLKVVRVRVKLKNSLMLGAQYNVKSIILEYNSMLTKYKEFLKPNRP